jgi:hypothetical protein
MDFCYAAHIPEPARHLWMNWVECRLGYFSIDKDAFQKRRIFLRPELFPKEPSRSKDDA